MPLYGFEPAVRKTRNLEDYQTPFFDYLDAKFKEGIESNVTTLLSDKAELDRAYGTFNVPEEPLPQGIPAPRLSAEAARAIIKEAGVKVQIPDDGIPQAALDILIKRRKDEAERQDAINRSPFGVRSFAGFGASLAAGVLDPLNVAAAFVPVVGPARYTLMLEKATGALGRVGARAGVGAIEGGLGMAALEPLTYGLHQGLQDDYTALDSILNIGFGTVLGGGLHVAGGAFADLVRGNGRAAVEDIVGRVDRTREQTRERLQELEGERAIPIELDRFASQAGEEIGGVSHLQGIVEKLQRTYITQGREAGRAQLDEMVAAAPESSGFSKEVATPGFIVELDAELARRTEKFTASMADSLRVEDEIKTLKASLDSRPLSAIHAEEADRIVAQAEERALDKAIHGVPKKEALLDEAREKSGLLSGEERMAESVRLEASAAQIAESATPAQREAALRIAVGQSADGRVVEVSPVFDSAVDARSAAVKQGDPGSVRVVDPESSQQAAEAVRTAPKSLGLVEAESALAKAEADLTSRWEALGRNPKDLARQLEPADKLAKQADELGIAARAAVNCGVL